MSIRSLNLFVATLLMGLSLSPAAWAQQRAIDLKPGDYIAAVVNQDVVAASEVVQRTMQLREEAKRRGVSMPDPAALHKQAMDALIDDRVLVTHARETSGKVDEPELDRVVSNVAAQNKLTMPQLLERLKQDGTDFRTFRENLRDQMMTERVREREVQARIRITDGDIDTYLEQRKEQANSTGQMNLAHILIKLPDGASEAVVAERKARAEAVLARAQAGDDFAKLAREFSDDATKERGGEFGLRPADRLPDLFVQAVAGLKSGELSPQLLRSGAGFHVLKVVERQGGGSLTTVTQTHARHVLLRPSAQLSAEVATRRLAEFKRAIASGNTSFEAVARENSEDGSAAEGGDLGWMGPGAFVPEFEAAMNALPLGGISDPVPSRFGVHLIQVVERRLVEVEMKALREQAKAALREGKYEEAYLEWVKDLRSRAYVEMREWLD
ncbi:peptidylprolyl isomerase [Paucibacter sp. B2R-40]|uniref:peptidylprolyl isomerase n=1 Tax=Paucibacter sp. B2R-40 TaxID=2893554 RepID=UPI0021E36502|nr:peptidylprolyl isomerase [Paucibacter sp. B2R-40]MCV2353606.1 peptidylprolyl isomerase [Paucibacter sp. B2R-40]